MGKPKKKSRDDDDDDRDDDEERPAKKKAKKQSKAAGNTRLIVLALGGVAIVGLIVCGGLVGAGLAFGWFGGGDKKAFAKADKDKNKNIDQDKDKDKDKAKVDPDPPTGTGPLVNVENVNKAIQGRKRVAEVEKILGRGLPLKGADADKAMKYATYKTLREFLPYADAYQWSNEGSVFFIFFEGGVYKNYGIEAK